MSDRAQKILFFAVACPLFFLFSLFLGAYWTFPYDHVRDYVVQEVERDGTTQLEIASLEPSWLTGVDLEGVRLSSVPDEPDAPPAELVLQEASARVSLLSLIAGETSVDFDTTIEGGGTIEGSYSASEESTHVEAHIASVDLRRVGILRDTVGLPVTGRADGDIDMTIGREAVNTQGNARITVRNLAIGDGETPLEIPGLGAGLTLERLQLGTLTFRMETERGAGRIEQLHADGEDAELWGTGSIRLMQPMRMSSIDMMIRVAFKDAYRTSSPRMEGLFALLDINPQVRPARTSNGALQWRIQGSFGGRIRMVPSGNVPMPEAD